MPLLGNPTPSLDPGMLLEAPLIFTGFTSVLIAAAAAAAVSLLSLVLLRSFLGSLLCLWVPR